MKIQKRRWYTESKETVQLTDLQLLLRMKEYVWNHSDLVGFRTTVCSMKYTNNNTAVSQLWSKVIQR